MRRLVCVLAVLLLSAVATLPLAAHAVAPGAPARAGALTPAGEVGTSLVSCILPQCNGPYCREPNGCYTCCN